jgi:hypothetical protein
MDIKIHDNKDAHHSTQTQISVSPLRSTLTFYEVIKYKFMLALFRGGFPGTLMFSLYALCVDLPLWIGLVIGVVIFLFLFFGLIIGDVSDVKENKTL